MRRWKAGLGIAAAFALLLGFGIGMQAAAEEEDVAAPPPVIKTITGMVEIQANAIEIVSADERYRIEGQDLSELAGKQVTATGTVRENDDGTLTLVVQTVEASEG